MKTANVTVSMTAGTFFPAWARWALPAALAVLGAIARSPLGPRLRRLSLQLPQRDLEEARARTRFVVEVHARKDRQSWSGAVRGRHMYGIGAWITADAAVRLALGEVTRCGVLAPSQAFEPRAYLHALAGHVLIDELHLPSSP